MDFDKIVTRLGDFGRYQKCLYFLVCLSAVTSGIFTVMSAIVLAVPDHRCKIPGYENDTYSIQSDLHLELINEHIPPSADDGHLYDQCHTYSFNRSSGTLNSQPINGSTVIKCHQWVYSYSVFKQTFTSKHNLVCDNSYKTSLAKSFYFVGIFVGAMVFGNLSDAIGRKTVFCISVSIQFVSTVALAWAPNVIVMYICWTLIGLSSDGMYATGFVIGLELVGPSKRIYTGVVVDYFFALGLVLLSGVAYLVRHWKYIELICALPIGLFLFYWWLLPESPRWLISKHRYREAEVVLRRAAKYNKVAVNDDLFLHHKPALFPQKDAKDGRVWHLFTTKVLLTRTLVIFFNWCVVNMVYYGLSLNSGNLGGNYYLNFLLSGLVEFPAYTLILLLLDRLGRKWLYCICMILGGVSCLSTIFTILYLEERYQPVTNALALLGKLGAAGAFGIIPVGT